MAFAIWMEVSAFTRLEPAQVHSGQLMPLKFQQYCRALHYIKRSNGRSLGWIFGNLSRLKLVWLIKIFAA